MQKYHCLCCFSIANPLSAPDWSRQKLILKLILTSPPLSSPHPMLALSYPLSPPKNTHVAHFIHSSKPHLHTPLDYTDIQHFLCKDEREGVILKACKSCMLVKYCNRNCQQNHWPKHKKPCKQRAAELHDEALFKEPPSKEDCPICFLPMPEKLLDCVSLPLATLSYRLTTLPKQMRDLHKWIQKNILHVVGSAFVKGVYTPYGSLVTMESVHIVIRGKITIQPLMSIKKIFG
jgi:hypothetical protein